LEQKADGGLRDSGLTLDNVEWQKDGELNVLGLLKDGWSTNLACTNGALGADPEY